MSGTLLHVSFRSQKASGAVGYGDVIIPHEAGIRLPLSEIGLDAVRAFISNAIGGHPSIVILGWREIIRESARA